LFRSGTITIPVQGFDQVARAGNPRRTQNGPAFAVNPGNPGAWGFAQTTAEPQDGKLMFQSPERTYLLAEYDLRRIASPGVLSAGFPYLPGASQRQPRQQRGKCQGGYRVLGCGHVALQLSETSPGERQEIRQRSPERCRILLDRQPGGWCRIDLDPLAIDKGLGPGVRVPLPHQKSLFESAIFLPSRLYSCTE